MANHPKTSNRRPFTVAFHHPGRASGSALDYASAVAGAGGTLGLPLTLTEGAVVDTAKIGELLESKGRVVPQNLTNAHPGFLGDYRGDLAQGVGDLDTPIRKPLRELCRKFLDITHV